MLDRERMGSIAEESYAWRARIGMLAPLSNFVTMAEWNAVLPDGVTVHEALMGNTETTRQSLIEMNKNVLAEAKKLALGLLDAAGIDCIILFGCTSGSFIGGPGSDQKIIKEIEDGVGIPATTTTTCVLEAFNDLGVRRIALIGPYLKEVLDAEVQFFEHYDVKTLYVKGMEYRYTKDISALCVRPYVFHQMAKEAYRSCRDIDAIFITCMASPAMKIISTLEQEMGIAVISSNSASLYGVLKKLGIKAHIENYGKIFGML